MDTAKNATNAANNDVNAADAAVVAENAGAAKSMGTTLPLPLSRLQGRRATGDHEHQSTSNVNPINPWGIPLALEKGCMWRGL